MTKQKAEKLTVGCRVLKDELSEIDAIATELGVSRSDWLYNLVREALGKDTPETVRSLTQRVELLERKFKLLAK